MWYTTYHKITASQSLKSHQNKIGPQAMLRCCYYVHWSRRNGVLPVLQTGEGVHGDQKQGDGRADWNQGISSIVHFHAYIFHFLVIHRIKLSDLSLLPAVFPETPPQIIVCGRKFLYTWATQVISCHHFIAVLTSLAVREVLFFLCSGTTRNARNSKDQLSIWDRCTADT